MEGRGCILSFWLHIIEDIFMLVVLLVPRPEQKIIVADVESSSSLVVTSISDVSCFKTARH